MTDPAHGAAATNPARVHQADEKRANRVRAMGIRSADLGAVALANGYAERLIGSIRRECLDHVVVFCEPHLRTLLGHYQTYYNECRTHLSLGKDAPRSRAVQARGRIAVNPILGVAEFEVSDGDRIDDEWLNRAADR